MTPKRRSFMKTSEIDSIYKKQIQKNAPKDYESWLLENNNTLADAKDAAMNAAASSSFTSPTYGTKAKELSTGGLLSSGYADYLKSLAARSDNESKRVAQGKIKIANDKTREGYSDYIKRYNAQQEKIQQSYILDIIERGLFDIEQAYKIALISGLSKERALYSAAKGITASKNEAIKKAISYAKERGYTHEGAKKYAIGLGLDEKSADRVAESISGLTKEERDRYASMSVEEYIASLKNN